MNESESKDRLFGPKPFSILLFSILAFRFPGIVTAQEMFALRDFPAFGLPLTEYLGWSLKNGELPLWNPFSCCGIPFAAQWNTMVFYPPHWIVALTSPASLLSLFCLAHLYFGGMGMFFLARSFTRSNLAAVAAGITYSQHGLVINSLMWPNNIAALAWFPWLALATRRALKQGDTGILTASLVGSLQMLTGAPEVILFSWTFILLLAVVETGLADPREKVLRLKRFSFIVMLTAATCAIQLLPFFELLAHSERANAHASNEWSAGPAMWLRLVTPLYDTFATPSGPRFHAEQSWTHSTYGGLLPLLLLGAAFRRSGQKISLLLLGVILLAGLSAHGSRDGAFGYLADWLPMRFPVKLLIFHALAFPLLAAIGLKALLARTEHPADWTQLLPGLAILCVLFLTAGLSIDRLPEERIGPAHASLLSRLAIGGLLVGILLGIIYTKVQRLHTLLATLLVAVIQTDIGTHQSSLAPSLPHHLAKNRTDLPFLKQQSLDVPFSRATTTAAAAYHSLYSVAPTIADRLRLNQASMAANINLIDRIPKTGGFFSLNPGAVTLLEEAMYAGPNGLHRGILELFGASHVMTYTNNFAWATNANAVSLLQFGAPPAFLDPDQALDLISKPTFSPRKQTILPAAASTSISTRNSNTNYQTSIIQYHPHHLRLQTRSDAPGIVSFAMTWYPNWKATIDGIETTLWPANHSFVALEVPAGTHLVELLYEDPAYEFGRAISVSSLALILLLAIRRPSRRTQN